MSPRSSTSGESSSADASGQLRSAHLPYNQNSVTLVYVYFGYLHFSSEPVKLKLRSSQCVSMLDVPENQGLVTFYDKALHISIILS